MKLLSYQHQNTVLCVLYHVSVLIHSNRNWTWVTYVILHFLVFTTLKKHKKKLVKLILRITSVYEESSVFTPISKKGNAKECSNYRRIALVSRASKVMLEILQARLQQYVNHEFPDVQAGFRKGRGTRDQIVNICWTWKKQESSRKTSISALLTMPKPLTVWIIINCGKFWKRGEYQTTWPASWEICMQVRKQQLELDMEQQTGSK